MEEKEIIFMLGQHDTRLEAIEHTTISTAADVRAIMATLDRQKGVADWRAPYGVWVRGTASAVLASALTYFLAWRYGIHR